ncbi:nucleotidyltransferase domain-containing protein [Marinobacter sp. ANT_B65]
MSDRVDAVQLILFGGRAYGDVHDESDADAAVVLAGLPMNFA